eukprot:233971-Pelagomonas_calceolata.AAC.3
MELISEFRDHFCQQLDNAPTGIRATIRRLMSLLQHCDRELWYHIEVKCKVCCATVPQCLISMLQHCDLELGYHIEVKCKACCATVPLSNASPQCCSTVILSCDTTLRSNVSTVTASRGCTPRSNVGFAVRNSSALSSPLSWCYDHRQLQH